MSTSALQQQVRDSLFYELPIDSYVENSRPEWLYDQSGQRLELDFYIPEAYCAIEVQGAQHYTYIPFFHGSWEGFKEQLDRDEKKRTACSAHGITLFEISEDMQIDPIVRMIAIKLSGDDNAESVTPIPARILHPAIDLFNLIWRKGVQRKNQIKNAEKILQNLIDIVSDDVNFTTYDQAMGRWVIELIVSAEKRIEELRSEVQKNLAARQAKKLKRKRERAIRNGELVPGVKYPPMPRNFSRAKKRNIKELPGIGYIVDGGLDDHLIQVDDTGFPICDCNAFFELDYPCVHIWRYLKTYDYPTLCEIRNIIRAEKLGGDA